MSERQRKISFSDTPRIRSFSTSDPVRLDVLLPPLPHCHSLSDHHRQRLADSRPNYRRFSEITKPDVSRLHVPATHNDPSGQISPRHSPDHRWRKTSHGQLESTGKKEKASDTVTVDRYITSIVQLCSNEALATPLDPPPKGSEVYEQVLEEFKEK